MTEVAGARSRFGSPGQFLASLLISGVLLWLAVRGADWSAMLAVLAKAQQLFLLLACLVLCISFLARALRWQVVLRAAKPVSLTITFWATMVGYLGNNFLPLRAGEVLRSVLLGRSAALSPSYVLATALTERLGDVVALAVMSFFGVLALAATPAWLRVGATVLVVPSIAGVSALLVLPRLHVQLNGILAALPLPRRFSVWASALLERFLLGLTSLRHPGRALAFVCLTAVIWLIDSAAALAIGRAFELALTLPLTLLLLAALGIASTVPSTPGSVGVWQFVAVTVLVPFGISRNEALVYILGLQAANLVPVVALGLIGLGQLRPGPVSKSGSPA